MKKTPSPALHLLEGFQAAAALPSTHSFQLEHEGGTPGGARGSDGYQLNSLL